MLRLCQIKVVLISVILITTIARGDVQSDCRSTFSPDLQVTACTEILKKNSINSLEKARILKYRAAAYSQLRKEQKAISDYTQAIRLNPDYALAYVGRGHIWLSRKNYSGAQSDFSDAIRLNPKSSSVFIARGYTYLVSGKLNQAVEDFSSAISIDPKNAIAFNNRGLAYRKLNRTEAAIKDYTFAIQLNPIYALAFSNRGFVFELNGKKEQAIKDYRSAIFLDPSLSAAKAGLKRLGVNTVITKEADKLVTSGKALAEKNCAWCHAIGRQINSPNKMAPPFRYIYKRYPVLDLRKPLTRSIDHPPNAMPKFRLSDWEMDTIIAYINSLSVPN